MRRLPPPAEPLSDSSLPAGLFDERRPPEHRTWALPLFILVSLLAHSLGFYAFHVIYPTPQDVPMPTATLTLVSLPPAESANGAQPLLADWLREADPALLVSRGDRQPDWARLERGKYQPLYERWKLAPEAAPRTTPFTENALALAESAPREPWNWNLAQAPVAMDPAWTGAPSTPPSAAEAPGTQIRITPVVDSGEHKSAPAPTPESLNLPPFRAEGESLANIQCAEFLLGADSSGRVLYTLTRRGSNAADLDGAAQRYLRALSLPALSNDSPARVSWWRAKFTWGKEVFPQP
jgi:hypothetical protein